jgi:hypothetical protein
MCGAELQLRLVLLCIQVLLQCPDPQMHFLRQKNSQKLKLKAQSASHMWLCFQLSLYYSLHGSYIHRKIRLFRCLLHMLVRAIDIGLLAGIFNFQAAPILLQNGFQRQNQSHDVLVSRALFRVLYRNNYDILDHLFSVLIRATYL